MQIDLFAFARLRQTASGTVSLRTLSRIDSADRDGTLSWSARGSLHGREDLPRLDVEVDGHVAMICQRCLQPMEQPIRIRARFLVATDEATAEVLDQDDAFDVVVGENDFELDTLIEDEVILALPSAPRHRVCPDGTTDALASTTKPSPFAALAVLKRGPGRAEDDDA